MWYRYTIVSALLGAFVLAVRAPWPRQPLAYVHLAVTGLLLHGVYIGGVFIAIAHGMSSGIAALIVGVQPLLTATLVGPLLGERLSTRQWLGFFVGFAGLVLTVLETLDRGELPLFGLVTCLCALLAITFGTLYQKRHTAGVDSRVGALVQFMATAVAAGLVANLFETRVVEWHPRFVFALAWLCLALSLGAISILWALIRRGAAARVASLFYLVPPVTALEGYFLFGETLHPVQMLGIATTAIGVALINR
jgi:drug/metabolite transporter (DMT)-like permease